MEADTFARPLLIFCHRNVLDFSPDLFGFLVEVGEHVARHFS